VALAETLVAVVAVVAVVVLVGILAYFLLLNKHR
jgi:uncharacterized membrane protein